MPVIRVKSRSVMTAQDMNKSDDAAFIANYIGETHDVIIVNPEEGMFMIIEEEEGEDGGVFLSMVDEDFINTRLQNIRLANIQEIIAEEI